MYIYFDESGSINNHLPKNQYFIISLVHVLDHKVLNRAYKRFVASRKNKLLELDQDKVSPKSGKVFKRGGKMFVKGTFKELKGSQFDKAMKQDFVEFFSQKPTFEIFYIKINNEKLTNRLCNNTAHVFNYTIKQALAYFIQNGDLPNEDCFLELDERNEKAESRHFLEDYLNTELLMNDISDGKFHVKYFESSKNNLIQIADVFANLYYSHLKTGGYDKEIQKLKDCGMIKKVYEFPEHPVIKKG